MENSSRAFYKSQRNDVLKALALLTMLIDHVGYLFFEDMLLYRTIGRIAFPIFAYQLAMGFRHTSSRVRYLSRLAIFSIISYVPYIYFDPQLEVNPLSFSILFQLLLGFVMLQVLEWGIDQFKRNRESKNPGRIAIGILLMLLTAIIAIGPDLLHVMFNQFHFSYGTYGMLLMLVFYLFGHKVFPVLISYLFVTFITTYMGRAEFFIEGIRKPSERLSTYVFALFERSDEIWSLTRFRRDLFTLEGYYFQLRSIMALPFIWILQKLNSGFQLPTFFAYWFYPAHISVLILIKWLMLNQ